MYVLITMVVTVLSYQMPTMVSSKFPIIMDLAILVPLLISAIWILLSSPSSPSPSERRLQAMEAQLAQLSKKFKEQDGELIDQLKVLKSMVLNLEEAIGSFKGEHEKQSEIIDRIVTLVKDHIESQESGKTEVKTESDGELMPDLSKDVGEWGVMVWCRYTEPAVFPRLCVSIGLWELKSEL